MNPPLRPACFLLLFGLLSSPSPLIAESAAGLQQNAQNTSTNNQSLREVRHQDPSWDLVKLHLPDPATATREQLETVADVLRARRFPEDALDYYLYALKRGGGNQVMLLNKIGVTQLELRHTAAARLYFQSAIKVQKKDPVAWNNLGAVEYMDGRFGNAISDYNRAIKLNKASAIYHSNLATALFEQKRYKDARDQFRIALQLDPDMAHHDGAGGLTAHMLSPEDHARYCFEMARLYAELGDETNMLRYLTMASEGGFDVMSEMRSDPKMDHYRKDTRVLVLVQNAKALRSGRASIGDSSVPPLPPVQPN
ncbi:MAG TPA: tetratricopeptide repeat protein [Edaphobacter sp.]|jgi:tetratricopeptide (TPR) repeat protein|nr:tetratricopeptide repeat protein [Edaphobacter sp.]